MAKLAAYRAKRDFKKTAEPRGKNGRAPAAGSTGSAGSAGSAFVIQKHDASRLHYDLRLELDGVMKSWAVTKGPSLVPGEKRLAVHVEDHPIEYNSFEGTIPEGEYGGGTVLLWDRGRWLPEGDPHKGYAKGHLEFRLEGEKLSGAWHLVRMRKKPREKQEAWLLIKSDDERARTEDAPDILDEKPLSVATGRDLPEIAKDKKGRVWDSSQGEAAEARKATVSATIKARKAPATKRKVEAEAPSPDLSALVGGTKRSAMPKAIEPCLATLASRVPKGEIWLHEIKWDGYRLIAFKQKDKVKLATRRGLDWTKRFPSIAEAIASLPVETAILDGEAVVEDENGVASFSALQATLSDANGQVASEALFYAFDLLFLEGHDLRPLPLGERKERLAGLVPPGRADFLRLGEHLEADGEAMVKSACGLGLEGIISKRRDRPYRSGRNEDWVKIKCTERQEFVIAGYVPSSATQKAVGSLILAYHEGEKLRAAGRSGTGYTAEMARDLFGKLNPIARKTSPIDDRLTADEKRGAVWVAPTLVAEIEFRGWTGEGRLRHAAFKGLREDKVASEIVREIPRDLPKALTAETQKPTPKRSSAGKGEVAGVSLSHPERVLWPEAGLTKLDLARYYESIAEWLLPELVDRPLSLVRCPGGHKAGCFFQKHSWAGLSDHILRERVRDEDGEEEILSVRDIAGIVSLVQASVLEIHPWGSRMADIERADRIVMDLDPGDDVAFSEVIAGAKELRERLSLLELDSFVKTTGGKGLHVVVPLTGSAAWPDVKAFAKALADSMEADAPKRYIAKASKSARRGLIYVDYLRNGRGATAIAPYSTRARPGATVAVPLAWSELTASLDPKRFTLETVPARLAKLKADPWADIRTVKQVLPDLGPKRRRK